jgi:hypothetical protein
LQKQNGAIIVIVIQTDNNKGDTIMFNDILQKGKEIINSLHEKIVNKRAINEEKFEIKNAEIKMSQRQERILEKLANGRKTQLCIKERAAILLELKINPVNSAISKKVVTSRNRVKRWRRKWIKKQNELNRIELEEPHKLKRTIIKILSDNERSGRPTKFKSEQVAGIIFLSLQEPKLLGLPLSHWTAESLKEAAINMKIVGEISVRQVGRFLNEMDIKVHQFQTWLNSIEKIQTLRSLKDELKKNVRYIKIVESLRKKAILLHVQTKRQEFKP